MPIPVQALETILGCFIAFWAIVCILLLYPIIQQKKLHRQIQRLQSQKGDPSR